MQLRLLDVVRERLGASYAPSAGFSSSSVYPGLNYLYAEIEANPGDIPELRAAVNAIARDLRESVLTDDELDRARAPSLEQMAQHGSANGYWLSVISQLQTRPDRAARLALKAVEKDLRAITTEDLQAAATLWLQDRNFLEVDILPGGKADH
jgi:zinc protease